MSKLRVWWNPQIGSGCGTLKVPVETVEEAAKVLHLLAVYDAYQFEHEIKPDYCNAGGLEMWDDEAKDWVDWECDCYDDPIEFCEERMTTKFYNRYVDELYKQVHF